MGLLLHPDFLPVYSDQKQEIDRIIQTRGEVYRQNSSRKTLRFTHSGKCYFLKVHTGVGWREIFKNLLQFRLPIISAHTEWKALNRLRTLGIDTLVPIGLGSYGTNPARMQSFLMTKDLGESITLENFLLSFPNQRPAQPNEVRFKRALIRKVAIIARTMHENGVNHRDFYLCHLRVLVSDLQTMPIENPRIFVMDLHRAQLRNQTPKRWAIKDLGALYFSTLGARLTQRDLFRFIAIYKNRPLRDVISKDRRFLNDVVAKSKKIHSHHQRMLSRQEAKGSAMPLTI